MNRSGKLPKDRSPSSSRTPSLRGSSAAEAHRTVLRLENDDWSDDETPVQDAMPMSEPSIVSSQLDMAKVAQMMKSTVRKRSPRVRSMIPRRYALNYDLLRTGIFLRSSRKVVSPLFSSHADSTTSYDSLVRECLVYSTLVEARKIKHRVRALKRRFKCRSSRLRPPALQSASNTQSSFQRNSV
jgi:hypothetical protein